MGDYANIVEKAEETGLHHFTENGVFVKLVIIVNKLRNHRIFKLFIDCSGVFHPCSQYFCCVSLGYHVNSGTNIKEVVDGIHTVEAPIYAKRENIRCKRQCIGKYEAFTLYAYVAPDRFGIGIHQLM